MNHLHHYLQIKSNQMAPLTLRWLALSVCVSLMQGCGLISHQSVYEGIRAADKTKTTGTTQTPAALPNYDRYEKERDALKK
jgi:multisubunit Na+/H+ antiporter MnhG subunit